MNQPVLARPIIDCVLSILVSNWPSQQQLTLVFDRSLCVQDRYKLIVNEEKECSPCTNIMTILSATMCFNCSCTNYHIILQVKLRILTSLSYIEIIKINLNSCLIACLLRVIISIIPITNLFLY